jgi:lambda family phage portal protein
MGVFRDMLSEGILGKLGIVRARNDAISNPFLSGQTMGGFDGGQGRRRLASWRPTQSSINAILAAQGQLLRSRCRDVMRNNPHAVAACENYVGNLIGAGIKPSSLLKDAAQKAKVQELWLDWTDEADADGLTDFYGMQSIIGRALFEAGECFVRFRARRESDGLSVPLQLELLESEMCPYLNQIAPNGNFIMNGVEFDFRNQRVAYWFLPQHPGDAPIEPTAVQGALPVRVPADQVLHIFRVTRPGQVRGVPMVAPALVRLFFLDQYDDAELERKKVAALFAAFIKSSTPEDILPLDPDTTDNAEAPSDPGIALTGLEPGTIQTLLPGEDVVFSEPADVGGAYEMFQYRQQLSAFAAMGVPYMLGTGDTRRASYSSLRGVIVEYRRKLEQVQYNIIAHQFCRPVWQRWFNDAVVAGALDIDLTQFIAQQRVMMRAKWIAPRFEWVDPLKDRQAEKLAVDAGFKARSDVVEAEGADPEENDARIASDKAREEQLGLVFPVATAAASQPPTDPQETANDQQDLQDGNSAEAA